MKLAIVILNYNGRNHLETFLENVIETSEGHDVIVADNASTDDSLGFISKFKSVRLIQNETNSGFAGGYNEALEKLKGTYDYYILLNSDIQVTENWIAPLVEAMKDEQVAACQPKIKSLHNKSQFEHAGASGGFIDKNYFPFCRGRIMDFVEQDNGQYDYSCHVSWASGAAMMINAKLFHKAEGFDADFFAHMEEIDLCIRLGHQGYKFKVVPESVVYHLGGGTLPYLSPKKIYLNFRNSLFLIVKNHKGWLLPMLLKRMALDAIAAVKFLSEGRFRFTWNVFMAHMSFYKNLRSLSRKRAKLKKDTSPILKYHGNILSNYFLERRKKYSQLNKRFFKL